MLLIKNHHSLVVVHQACGVACVSRASPITVPAPLGKDFASGRYGGGGVPGRLWVAQRPVRTGCATVVGEPSKCWAAVGRKNTLLNISNQRKT